MQNITNRTFSLMNFTFRNHNPCVCLGDHDVVVVNSIWSLQACWALSRRRPWGWPLAPASQSPAGSTGRGKRRPSATPSEYRQTSCVSWAVQHCGSQQDHTHLCSLLKWSEISWSAKCRWGYWGPRETSDLSMLRLWGSKAAAIVLEYSRNSVFHNIPEHLDSRIQGLTK